MQIVDRDEKILMLLWQCGGCATAQQLAFQEWDRGVINTRLWERLKKLVDSGYVQVQPFDRTLYSELFGRPRQSYTLGRLGMEWLGVSWPGERTEEWCRVALLKNAVALQLNQRGYQLCSLELLGQQVESDGWLARGAVNQLVVIWNVSRTDRPARSAVRALQGSKLDTATSTALAMFSSPHAYASFREFQESGGVPGGLAWLAHLALEPLRLAPVREAVPFRGWLEVEDALVRGPRTRT